MFWIYQYICVNLSHTPHVLQNGMKITGILWVRNMDKRTLEFVTYCIGKLSTQLRLSQQEVYKRLKTSGILYEYIIPSYDVLHTFSSRYLMEDLTQYMREKGVLET